MLDLERIRQDIDMVMQDPEIDQDSLDLLAEHGQALTNEVERLRQSHIPNHITEETFAMFETVFGETIPGDATLWGYTKHACAEVERLRAEKETLTTTVRALREACESALSYFRAAWTETGHHPASHYADYVDELAEAIGK